MDESGNLEPSGFESSDFESSEQTGKVKPLVVRLHLSGSLSVETRRMANNLDIEPRLLVKKALISYLKRAGIEIE